MYILPSTFSPEKLVFTQTSAQKNPSQPAGCGVGGGRTRTETQPPPASPGVTTSAETCSDTTAGYRLREAELQPWRRRRAADEVKPETRGGANSAGSDRNTEAVEDRGKVAPGGRGSSEVLPGLLTDVGPLGPSENFSQEPSAAQTLCCCRFLASMASRMGFLLAWYLWRTSSISCSI